MSKIVLTCIAVLALGGIAAAADAQPPRDHHDRVAAPDAHANVVHRDNGEHRGWDRDRGMHRGWDHGRGRHRGWSGHRGWHHGWGHRRHCRWMWRHHHRVRICRGW
ncbi:MAG TPA: hypothetical protein VFW19_08250 [Allosphingosinicella sp.]|nr:hypothetical protein [Allosphingosinicella sp.]